MWSPPPHLKHCDAEDLFLFDIGVYDCFGGLDQWALAFQTWCAGPIVVALKQSYTLFTVETESLLIELCLDGLVIF
jgi:hypothetical protein